MSRPPKQEGARGAPAAKQRRQAGAAHEGLFETAFHNSPAMQSVVRAADSVLVEVNDTFLKKLGFTREEVIGKTPFDLNIWVEPEKLVFYREELQSKGFLLGYEVRLRARDGTLLTALLSSHPVKIGGVPHFLSAGVDITARKQAEAELRVTNERLRQSEERFSRVFRASPALVVITRMSDRTFVAANEVFLRTTGFTEAEVLGRTPLDLNLHVDLKQLEVFRQVVRDQGAFRDREFIIRAKDGQLRTLLVSAELIDIDGMPHMQTVGLDITERKAAEQKLRESELQLQSALAKERELSQLKSDFVSLVSHEFRTPLEIIMSSVDNLDRYHDRLPAEKREQLLRTINRSVRRMSGMMEEVLVLGRLETDRMTFKPAPFDWRSFGQRLCDEIESVTARRCPIHWHADAAPEQAFGDEGVLRHIFTNLLSNAVKYSAPGQGVDFIVRQQGDDAVCCVADQGCGIPEADQKRLFHAFHRGSNVRQIPGTGLGLLIVQRCVELHGGEVQFESTEGKGTTFTVRLPLFAEPT